ncbi:MAG: carboxylate-amine ligase, partial [Gammaproteobacteria bacterium]
HGHLSQTHRDAQARPLASMTGTMTPYPLFAVYGIEIEYMIVDRERLAVLPVTDQILKKVAGAYVSDYEDGPIAWSNELVLHVMELKSNGPVTDLAGLPDRFLSSIRHVNAILENMNGILMPTAMHPLMDPRHETRLWPHESSEIYDTFNRIFDCRGHGWSNLQSMHVNLPFADDREFARLHAAIRILMPIMPALAASSPVMEGNFTGLMDTRLETYRKNSAQFPIITGQVIPEPVRTLDEYREKILQPMYQAIAPYDPAGNLQHEWLNARGAITRFERNTIEVRVLDTQECPLADMAVASMVTGALKFLVSEQWSTLEQQLAFSTPALARLFLDNVRHAEQAVIRDKDYLKLFAFPDKQCEAHELWQYLLESGTAQGNQPAAEILAALKTILAEGTLARRICTAIGRDMRKTRLEETYRRLCQCLAAGELFTGFD